LLYRQQHTRAILKGQYLVQQIDDNAAKPAAIRAPYATAISSVTRVFLQRLQLSRGPAQNALPSRPVEPGRTAGTGVLVLIVAGQEKRS
jgi:hypothetical protein